MLSRVDIAADAADLTVAVVVSRYHESVTGALESGAVEQFAALGGASDRIQVIDAPGTFELVALCRSLVMDDSGSAADRFDAVVALGCVITGETTHDQYINSAVSSALASMTVSTGVPIAFGVLTCQTMEQALARAGGAKGNKGAEAMTAAVAAACTCERLQRESNNS